VQEAAPTEETVKALAPIVSEAPRLKPPHQNKNKAQAEEVAPAPAPIEMPQTIVEEAMASIVEAPAPVIQEAKLFKPAAPVYPERCTDRAAKQEAVTVRMNVSADGRPFDASVVDTTNACFNSAALQAAQRMRFLPRTVDGVAQAETGKTATIRFVR
jgi:TonB family protein